MTINFWNTITPLSATFNMKHQTGYTGVPVNQPLPNHILPPGAQPALPRPAIPAPAGNLKQIISNLPSIFSFTHGNN